jgi:CelD/BcsL family acetyltransferase involved in cellulose biosynthesis
MVNQSEQTDWTITVIKGMEGLQAIKQDWIRIYSGLERPAYHLDWRWMMSIQSCLIDQELYFLVMRRRDIVVLILPLHLRSSVRAGIKHSFLSFPYHNHVVLSDVLLDSDQVEKGGVRVILDFLETQKALKWDYIKLAGIYERSPLRDLLLEADLKLEEVSSNAYFDWKSGKYDETLSKKFIKNIRRLFTKAEKEQGVVQTRFVNNIDELPDAFIEFLDLEASGWKGESGTSTAIKQSPRLVAFYREVMERFSEDGTFQINLLEINSIPAAGQLCIKSGCAWYILKVGYNDSLKQYGPGNILMLSFLEYVSADPGCSELNLVTSPVWANRWHLKKRPVYSTKHYNTNIKGRLSRFLRYSNRKFKGLVNDINPATK